MPDLKLLLIGCVVVAVCVAAAALLRARRGAGPMVTQTRPLPEMKGSHGAEPRRIGIRLGRELLPLLERGRTDEAVALVRERTGCGAEEARASVEKLERLMRRLGME